MTALAWNLSQTLFLLVFMCNSFPFALYLSFLLSFSFSVSFLCSLFIHTFTLNIINYKRKTVSYSTSDADQIGFFLFVLLIFLKEENFKAHTHTSVCVQNRRYEISDLKVSCLLSESPNQYIIQKHMHINFTLFFCDSIAF